MPIYEYQCTGCGQVVEKWQKMSEDPLTTCPACGGSLSKLISNCTFSLKGSGWYVTDYSGKMQSSNMAGNSKESGAGAAAAATDSPKAAAEPAAAPKKFK